MRNLYASGDCGDTIEIESGDHICYLAHDNQDFIRASQDFIQQALTRQHKVLCLLDPTQTEQTLESFWNSGIKLESYMQAGQVEFRTFPPPPHQVSPLSFLNVIDQMLEKDVRAAREQDLPALEIYVCMDWISQVDLPAEFISGFETLINHLVERQPAAVVCMYDRRKFTPGTQLSLLASHPYIGLEGAVFENFYYVPGESHHLAAENPSLVLDSWLEKLKSHHYSQQKLWFTSTHDPDTGLYNRAFFQDELKRLENDPSRPVGMVMVLLDNPEMQMEGFDPAVIRTYLGRAAQVLRQASRHTDVLARVDERQFVVLTPGGDFGAIEETIQRIRTALKTHNQDCAYAPLNLFLWGATSRGSR